MPYNLGVEYVFIYPPTFSQTWLVATFYQQTLLQYKPDLTTVGSSLDTHVSVHI